MKLIAHRGNIYKPIPELENSPGYIIEALVKGFDVEIDVWKIGEKFYLGHDEPAYEVDASFFKDNRMVCHAKNIHAFEYMLANNFHCFWHDQDSFAMTSWGIIWTVYKKGTYIPNNSIQVIQAHYQTVVDISPLKNCYGVCSDCVGHYSLG